MKFPWSAPVKSRLNKVNLNARKNRLEEWLNDRLRLGADCAERSGITDADYNYSLLQFCGMEDAIALPEETRPEFTPEPESQPFAPTPVPS